MPESNLFRFISIFTEVTVNAAANRYYEPGPGRTYFINVRFDFGLRWDFSFLLLISFFLKTPQSIFTSDENLPIYRD